MARQGLPELQQFRLEPQTNGLIHLVFDAPGRTMNVFSNAAIGELGRFASWLAVSDVRGVVIRSGKETAFCAGADLAELGTAYEMIMAKVPSARFNTAFDHFFQLSAAIRALETSGKPVAVAIANLALGGGCEFAMGAHYRVLADDPRAAFGLPESLVGLLPGGGGTQRLPRLVDLTAALPILLAGERLSGQAALDAGLADRLVPLGQEVEAAEAWLLGSPTTVQPWDRPDWRPMSPAAIGEAIDAARRQALKETLGHYPAPLAILDCLEFGLPQTFDGAIRSEMAIFAKLIQRPEPRNMIASLFLGKMDYDRRRKRDIMPAFVTEVVTRIRTVVAQNKTDHEAMAAAGFSGLIDQSPAPVRDGSAPGFWLHEVSADPRAAAAAKILQLIFIALAPLAETLSTDERRLADYAAVQEVGYPAYLGGPFTHPGEYAAEMP